MPQSPQHASSTDTAVVPPPASPSQSQRKRSHGQSVGALAVAAAVALVALNTAVSAEAAERSKLHVSDGGKTVILRTGGTQLTYLHGDGSRTGDHACARKGTLAIITIGSNNVITAVAKDAQLPDLRVIFVMKEQGVPFPDIDGWHKVESTLVRTTRYVCVYPNPRTLPVPSTHLDGAVCHLINKSSSALLSLASSDTVAVISSVEE